MSKNEYENLTFDVKDNVAIIGINRPKAMNALNKGVREDLRSAMDEVETNDDIRTVIITGAGNKAFVAGADISEFVGLTPSGIQALSTDIQTVFDKIEMCKKPVIAAINGMALGGGCELLLACHMRICSDNALFGLPELGLGVIPGGGGTQRLPRIIGKGRALEVMLAGVNVDAQEAHRIGLVNRVVPGDKLMEECGKIAKQILKKGPVAVGLTLQAVNQGMLMDQTSGLLLERNLGGLTFSSDDAKEGINAFLEKRRPNFKGC